MNTKFTHEDILRYIYKETTPDESKQIQEYLNKDRGAKLFYLESKDTLEKLDHLNQSPNDTSLRIVMETISKSSHLEEMH